MSNKIGRIVSFQRAANNQQFYSVETLEGDLNTVVDTLIGIAIDAEFEAGDLVHLNVVQGRHYIVSAKVPEGVTMKVLGKWQPDPGGGFDDLHYNDGTNESDNPSPATLMYVVSVMDNTSTYDLIKNNPDGVVTPEYATPEALCRLIEGNPDVFELEVGTLIQAYQVEDIYFTIKPKRKTYGQVMGKFTSGPLEFAFDPSADPQPETLNYVVRLYGDSPLGAAIRANTDPLPSPTGDYVLVRQLTGSESRTIAPETFVEVSYVDGEGVMDYGTAGTTVPCRLNVKVDGMSYTYKADIYEDGIEDGVAPTQPAASGGQVEQVNINVDQTIPDGTWAMASLNSNGIWYVQVAVWL